jgi:hypothetical protein
MAERQTLRMDDDEVWRFLESRSVAVVSGRAASGLTARRAHLGAGSGRLELALVPDERVFDLDRHPEVCVCVDAYPSHETIMGVIAYGSATYGPGSTMTLRVDHVVSFDFSKAAR